MNPKYPRIGTSSFSLPAEKSRKRCLEPLILTPPRKSSTIAFYWNFIGSFFCVRVPDIISKLKNKNCQSEQDVDQVLYFEMDGQQCENKQHGDTVPEKARDMFLCSLKINI